MALLHAHLAKVPEAPHKIRAEIPQVLSKIVLKLMAKNEEDRYQSALGLKYDLEKCLEQLGAQGAAPGHASDSAPDDVLEASLETAHEGKRRSQKHSQRCLKPLQKQLCWTM